MVVLANGNSLTPIQPWHRMFTYSFQYALTFKYELLHSAGQIKPFANGGKGKRRLHTEVEDDAE